MKIHFFDRTREGHNHTFTVAKCGFELPSLPSENGEIISLHLENVDCLTCLGIMKVKPAKKIFEAPLPNGSTLYWKQNEAGGRTYFSDEVGGGVHVWDTCLVDQSTVLAALTKEWELSIQEVRQKHAQEKAKKLCAQVEQAHKDAGNSTLHFGAASVGNDFEV